MPLNRHQEAEAEDEMAYVPPPGAAAEARRGAAPPQHEPAQRRDQAAPPAVPDEGGEGELEEEWDDEDEQEDEEAVAPPQVRRRGRPRSAGLTRGQQLFVELGGLLTFGVTPYGLDMAFTVLALTRVLLPASVGGLSIPAAYHIFTSLGQRYFLVQRGPIRIAGALLLGVNTITNLYGAIPALDRVLGPAFLGGVPRDPGGWPAAAAGAAWAWLAGSVVSMLGGGAAAEPAWPTWLAGAAALTLGCALVAWWSEIVLAYFIRRVKAVWKG